MEDDNNENPWTPNLEEYLYFCCPECDMKDQSKEKFLKHALDEHPKAKEVLLVANKVKVKQEIVEDETFLKSLEKILSLWQENYMCM